MKSWNILFQSDLCNNISNTTGWVGIRCDLPRGIMWEISNMKVPFVETFWCVYQHFLHYKICFQCQWNQAIIWTNAELLLIGPLRTKVSEMSVMCWFYNSGYWNSIGQCVMATGTGKKCETLANTTYFTDKILQMWNNIRPSSTLIY